MRHPPRRMPPSPPPTGSESGETPKPPPTAARCGWQARQSRARRCRRSSPWPAGRSGHPAEDEGLGRHDRALVIIAATIVAGGSARLQPAVPDRHRLHGAGGAQAAVEVTLAGSCPARAWCSRRAVMGRVPVAHPDPLPVSRFYPAAARRGKSEPEAYPGGTRSALSGACAAGGNADPGGERKPCPERVRGRGRT